MHAETEKLMREFLRFTSQAVTPETVVGVMSGGERQGVAIARALHFEAELVILDEPTMGLSVTETRKTLDFVRGIREAGKACIFIDHNIFNVHEVAERVIVIDRGRIAGEFRPAEMTVHDLVEPAAPRRRDRLDRGGGGMSGVEAQTRPADAGGDAGSDAVAARADLGTPVRPPGGHRRDGARALDAVRGRRAGDLAALRHLQRADVDGAAHRGSSRSR